MSQILAQKITMLLVFCAIDLVNPAIAESISRAVTKNIVIEVAKSTGVPPSLAVAVAKVGSNFRTNAMSEAGARGVMQITPMMAREAFGVDPKELWRARRNIELGVGYLKHLIGQYADRWDLALSHYKSGSVLSHRTHTRVSVTAWTYVHEVLYYQKQYSDLDLMGKNVEVRGKIWAVARVITRPNGAKRSHVPQSENSDFTLGGGSDGNVSLEFSLDPAPGIETENLGDFAAAVVAALSLAFGGPLGIMAGLGYAFAIDKSPTPRDLSLFGGLIGDYIDGAVVGPH